MSLSDEQKQSLAQQLADGASIADIQRTVNDEFKIGMTYMEVRFLIDDLDIEVPNIKPEADKAEAEEATPAEAELVQGVTVEVDKIKQPGAAISGEVRFTDGQTAKWYVDDMGRLGLNPAEEGYQPSEEDIQEFQMKLREQLQGPQL